MIQHAVLATILKCWQVGMETKHQWTTPYSDFVVFVEPQFNL